MVNINLLPKEILEKQKVQQMLKLSITAVVGIIFITAIIFLVKASVLPGYSAKLSSLEKELKQVQPIVDEVNKLKGIKSTLESRKQLVEQLLNSGLIYPKFMTSLMETLPEGIWFTNINTVSNRGPDKNIISIKVNANCNSYDKIVIADFISNLENNPTLFKEVKLGPINIIPEGSYEKHTFNIMFDYIVPQ